MGMSRGSAVAAALLATLLLACGRPKGPPNVILISIDTLRADHLHCYGYDRETSPALDRLAREGALFENVFARSSWTLPTHASLLTGLTAKVHMVQFDASRIDPAHPFLPDLFRAAGYRTRGVISGPYLDPIFGFGRGYAPGDYERVVFTGYEGATDFHDPRLGRTVPLADHQSHRTITSPTIADRAIDFLRKNGDERFFLFLHFFDAHSDYIPPEAIWRKFDPDYDGQMTGDGLWFNTAFRPGMKREDFDHIVALYDGEIFFTDSHVGRLLDALDRLDLTADTIVVVTSDHGEEFLEHGGKTHRATLYDEVLRVPLIIRQPGRIVPGLRIAAQTRHIDVLPTVLELAGLPVPPTAMGRRDLAPVLLGEKSPQTLPPTYAVSRLFWPERARQWVAVRTPEHKYILRGGQSEELYDLRADPGEQRPIDDPVALEEMRSELRRSDARSEEFRKMLPAASRNDFQMPASIRQELEALGYIQAASEPNEAPATVGAGPPGDAATLPK